MTLEAHSHFKLWFHEIMGRVQQKVQFSHFSVVKCKIWKEIMNIWNYDICVWHPPTLIYVLISYVKEIRFWNWYPPPTFYANVLKICSFFLTPSLKFDIIFFIKGNTFWHPSASLLWWPWSMCRSWTWRCPCCSYSPLHSLPLPTFLLQPTSHIVQMTKEEEL